MLDELLIMFTNGEFVEVEGYINTVKDANWSNLKMISFGDIVIPTANILYIKKK